MGEKYQLILIFVLFLFEIVLLNLPLTNHLSFEYALVNSIILFVIGGILFIHKAREYDKNYFEIISDNIFLFTSLPLLPLLLGFLSTVLFSVCPFNHGMLFYLVVSIPAFCFGTVFGLLSFYFWKKYPVILFIIFVLFIGAITVLEFYLLPIVYFYNIIIGYFPGTIYDEFVSVTHKLISYRLFNVVFVSVIVLFTSIYSSSRKNKITLAIILILLQVLFMYSKPYLGFTTNRAVLEERLHTKIVTEHFEIYTSKKIGEDEKKYLAFLHEYYYDSILREVKFKMRDLIRSYIYKNEFEKEILFGSRNANVAKPWLRETYISFETLENSLRHELAHILLSEFGNPIFGVTLDLNPAIIEGYAMAFDETNDFTDIHQLSFLAKTSGYEEKLSELFRGYNFFGTYSGISYIKAGSFIKYLVEKYGAEKVIAAYRSGDIDRKLKTSFAELEKEYNSFLDSSKFESNKSKAQLYFGGNTIFKKYCVRSAASDIQHGWKLFNKKEYSEAFLIFNRVYKYSGSANSLQGMLLSLWEMNDYQKAQNILEKELPNFEKHQSYFRLKLLYADLLIMNDNHDKAVVIYNELDSANVHFRFNLAAQRRMALFNFSNNKLKDYLAMNEKEKAEYLSKVIINNPNPIQILESIENSNDKRQFVDYYKLLSKLEVNDIIAAFTLLKASEYYLKKGEYKTAQILAIKSLELDEKNSEQMFLDNLKKVNWFQNNSEEIRITYVN